MSFPSFLEGRRCWIFETIPGYSPGVPRQLLICLDGETLFRGRSSWSLEYTVSRLMRAGKLPPLIVVGIESSPTEREHEYDPLARNVSINGDSLLGLICTRLVPKLADMYGAGVDTTQFAMAGASLGGLLSAYAGYTPGTHVNRVIALSPTYHWPTPPFERYAESIGRPHTLRFYQSTGTVHDNYIDRMRDVLESQGLVSGRDYRSDIWAGAEHRSTCWAGQIGSALEFVYARE